MTQKLKFHEPRNQTENDEHLKTDKILDENIKGEKEEVDSKLELLKFTSQVQSRIKTDISSDFTLAKFNEKDKEFIIEHTVTAYFTKKVLQLQKKKLVWEWQPMQQYWQRRKLNKNEQDQIETLANLAFDGFMNRIYMLAITNRNVDANHLLKYLSGIGDDGQPIIDPEEAKITTKLKKLIKPKEEDEIE